MSPIPRIGWRRALRPQVFVPVVLSLALLSFALGVSDLPRVAGRLKRIDPAIGFAVFGLACGYLLLKGLQFRLLLTALRIRPRWRQLVLAFAIGEMTLPIPSGIYVQNYVLQRLGAGGFARSAAATTVTLAIEGTVAALTLLAVGVPGWPGFRLGLLAAALAAAVVLGTLFESKRIWQGAERLASRGRWSRPVQGLLETARGIRSVAAPAVLGPSLALAAVYLGALVASLWVVGRGLGLDHFSMTASASIYFFSLGVTLALGGVLAQLGVLEVAGIGAARAWGYGLSDALATLLAFRILWMASTWLVSGSLMLALWGEFRRSADDGCQEAID